MNRSIWMLLIQLSSVIIGFIITLYIAKNTPSSEYSILGVYNLVITFIAMFSFIGFETDFSRNGLKWLSENKNKLYISIHDVFISRTILWVIISPFVGIYIYYLSSTSYNGNNLYLFLTFLGMAYFYSIFNGIILILRGLDKFIPAVLIMFFSNIIIKTIGCVFFFYYSFYEYIYILILGPVLSFFIALFVLNKYILLKDVIDNSSIKGIKIRIKEVYQLGISGYVSYLKQNLDTIVMPLVLSPEYFGTYTFAKNIESIIKQAIENIFDPLTQHLVRLKNNLSKCKEYIIKLKGVSNKLLFIGVIGIFITYYSSDYMISILGLEHYDKLNVFLIFIVLSQVIYLSSKVIINSASLLMPKSTLLKLDIITLVMISIPLFFIGMISYEYIYIYRVYVSSIIGITTLIYFRKWLSQNEN